jgi:radical SAM protein with 4Fe4S-binding SPASM domain
MEHGRKKKLWNVAGLYRHAMRLHSGIPFRLMPGGRAFPAWHYFFEVTRRCNLRCSMCQYRDWFERHSPAELIEGELTTDEWRGVVDQTGRFSLITFTGGEPWVRQDFLELLEYASARRRTHFITNGTLLTDDRVRRCVELSPKRLTGKGLCFVGVSIDGPRDVHDAIRGREGAFDETLEAARMINRHREEGRKRCPMIHVTAVIQEEALEGLPELPVICAQAGADVLNLTLEVAFPGLEGVGEVDPEEFCDAAPAPPRIHPFRLEKYLDLTQEAAERAGIELRLPDMPRRDILRYHDGGLDLDRFTCRGAWTNLYVGANGDVYPCFIYRLGSVREERLALLWNGARMREFRRRLRDTPFCICQGCCHLEYTGKKGGTP